MTRSISRLGSVALLATLLAATALPASAQRMRTERVRFTRGTSSATLRSAARPGRATRYLVGVSAGQTLSASIEDTGGSDCWVQVFSPGRSIQARNASPNEDGDRTEVAEWTGRLSRAGDYQVMLTNRERVGTCGLTISAY